MAGRSSERDSWVLPLSPGRLAAGIAILVAAGMALLFGVVRFRSERSPGDLIYVTEKGIFRRGSVTGQPKELEGPLKDVHTARVRSDGARVSYELFRGRTYTLDLATGVRLRVLKDSTVFPIGWDGGGRLIILEAFGPTAGALERIYDNGNSEIVLGGVSSPFWLGPETFLALVNDNVSLVLAQRDRPPQTTSLVEHAYPLALSPDRSRLLYVSSTPGKERVVVARVAGTKIRSPRTVFRAKAYFAAMTDGGSVALTGTDRSGMPGTWVLDPGRRARRVIDDQTGTIAWTRDGRKLVYYYHGSLYVRDPRRGTVHRLTPKGDLVAGWGIVP